MEKLRGGATGRNFGDKLWGETAGRNFRRNYGRNSGEIIAKIRGGIRKTLWQKVVFFERVLETAWPRSHQKIYGGGSCASVSATRAARAVRTQARGQPYRQHYFTISLFLDDAARRAHAVEQGVAHLAWA